MADLTGTPTYVNTLRQLEPTDPAHPNTWNPNYQALLNNDAFLRQLVEALSQSFTSHTGNKNNPHGVTAAQIGAATASHTHSANDLPKASTSGQGVVQLSDSVTNTSKTVAATASAVKAAMDRANEAYSGSENVLNNHIAAGNHLKNLGVVDRSFAGYTEPSVSFPSDDTTGNTVMLSFPKDNQIIQLQLNNSQLINTLTMRTYDITTGKWDTGTVFLSHVGGNLHPVGNIAGTLGKFYIMVTVSTFRVFVYSSHFLGNTDWKEISLL